VSFIIVVYDVKYICL